MYPIYMDHSRVSAQNLYGRIKNLISLLVMFKRFPIRIPVRIASVKSASCVSAFVDEFHIGPCVCHFRSMEILLFCLDILDLGLK